MYTVAAPAYDCTFLSSCLSSIYSIEISYIVHKIRKSPTTQLTVSRVQSQSH